MRNHTKVILLSLLCTIIISVAQVLLKIGSANFELAFNQIYNFPLLLGGALYVSGTFVLIKAFKWGEYSTVYLIMASSSIFVTLLSVKFLEELISAPKVIGLLTILAGVIYVGEDPEK